MTFTIAVEPRDAVYRRLCEFAERAQFDVLLIVRDRPPMGTDAIELLTRLEPFVVRKNRTNEWPGTRLLDHTAIAVLLRPDAVGWAVIRDAADRLFDWQHPALPEDLCFMRRDGSTFLGKVAHEEDAFLELDASERDALATTIPELRLEDGA